MIVSEPILWASQNPGSRPLAVGLRPWQDLVQQRENGFSTAVKTHVFRRSRSAAMSNLKQSTVTIDAIGCQKEIAQKVLDRGGQYVLAVKANQGALHDDIRTFLDDAIERGFQGLEHDLYERTEKGHGRIETRRCWTTSRIDWLCNRHD